jgi:hypothetical protein
MERAKGKKPIKCVINSRELGNLLSRSGLCLQRADESALEQLLPPPDNRLSTSREECGHGARQSLGQLEEFDVADATCSTLDLCDGYAADVPSGSLATAGEACLAETAGDTQPANLGPDKIFRGGRHGAESLA